MPNHDVWYMYMYSWIGPIEIFPCSWTQHITQMRLGMTEQGVFPYVVERIICWLY